MNTMYDGDTMSSHGTISDEANSETDEYMNSLRFMVRGSGELNIDVTALTEMAYYNVTRDPED